MTDQIAPPAPRLWRRRGARAALAVAALGVAGVTGAAVVSASVPDSSGVIHGCYIASAADNSPGSPLVIIDSAKTHCPNGATSISWNQTGPQGPPGQPATVHGYGRLEDFAKGAFPTTTITFMWRVAPGNYVFTATVEGTNPSATGGGAVTCSASSDGDNSTTGTASTSPAGSAPFSVTVTGVLTNVQQSVKVSCTNNSTAFLNFGPIQWSAVAVNAVN